MKVSVQRAARVCSLLAACAITGAATARVRADDRAQAACAEATAIEVMHHQVWLSLQLAPARLHGRGRIWVRARRPTREILLDVEALRVLRVASVVGSLGVRRFGKRLCVRLPKPLAAQEQLALSVAWEVPTDRAMPRFAHDHVWAGYRASSWMPTLQDPAQRATLSLRIDVPAGMRAVASGEAGAIQRAGARDLYSFELTQPSPPFLYAFAVGHFALAERRVDGITLRALGRAGLDLARALDVTASMLRVAIHTLGTPPPSSTYTQVFVDGDAAQEAAGFALLSAASLNELRDDPDEDWIFAHELLHQWFGWRVACADFADYWLNEGFATYLTGVLKQARRGPGAYARERARWVARSERVHVAGLDAPLSLSNPARPRRAPPAEHELPQRGVTYARGALVLEMLRDKLGEVAFWRGVQRYLRQRAGKGARSEDLKKALEVASGRDLRAFFDRWVYGTEAP